MNENINDLHFILSVIEELIVDPEDHDFDPSYVKAQDRKKLAIIKLNRMIRQVMMDLNDNGGNMIEYIVKVHPDRTEWYLNDQLHREGGPAIEFSNGGKLWYLNDKRHREGGPAIEYASGEKRWYLNDQLHRLDGPAIEYASGDKRWYLNDKHYTEEEFIKATNPIKELTTAEIEKLLGYAIKVVK